jgi:GAF domain-containing protein
MKLNGIETWADPIKDTARLTEIGELRLTELTDDPELQALAADAAVAFNLPIGVVSIVLDEAQYFIARTGVDGWVGEADGTPVEWSFCRNVVRSASDFVVEDASVHPVMKDSPLVALEGLACYAGTPMVSSNGHVLGSFCVKGKEVRSFSEDEMVLLREYAARAVRLIENRHREVA